MGGFDASICPCFGGGGGGGRGCRVLVVRWGHVGYLLLFLK